MSKEYDGEDRKQTGNQYGDFILYARKRILAKLFS